MTDRPSMRNAAQGSARVDEDAQPSGRSSAAGGASLVVPGALTGAAAGSVGAMALPVVTGFAIPIAVAGAGLLLGGFLGKLASAGDRAREVEADAPRGVGE